MEKKIIKSAQIVVYDQKNDPVRYIFDKDTRIVNKYSEVSLSQNRIEFEYPFIEQVQALFDKSGNEWFFTSQATTNNTYINDEMIERDQRIQLKKGDIIKISKDDDLLFMVFMENHAREVEWKRVFFSSLRQDDVIHLHPASSIGILEEVDIVPDYFKTDLPHATMYRKNGLWYIKDINTKISQDILINQCPLETNHALKSGDMIRIQDSLFFINEDSILYDHTILKKNPLSIDIRSRTVYNFLKPRYLLKDISLTIQSGEMVLLLGGSGAGKTTFVNAITGYEKADATILQGNKNIYQNYQDMKYEIGFVPQQDLVRLEDSVYNTLMDAANMRLPLSMSDKQKEERVQQVLHIFGLSKLKKSLVSKLSGGQRKRLSIGIEFIADPTLFILDEPDSGLDGAMARELMSNLRTIANENRIVCVITHTPDRVIDLFDKVIVLAKDSSSCGRLAFYGSPLKAREFFKRRTMEDIVFAINSKEEGGEGLADHYIELFKKYREDKEIDHE